MNLDCIRNDSPIELDVELEAFEFTWNCPSVQQPDFGVVKIRYRPKDKIVETKALKFYLQSFRNKNAFNEELCVRICMDLAYVMRPEMIDVRIEQNSRGGIKNSSHIRWDSLNQAHADALEKYKPRKDFRGGWPMVKAEVPAEPEKAAKRLSKAKSNGAAEVSVETVQVMEPLR
jgi:7-cyano-7-deazaguanine reductase